MNTKLLNNITLIYISIPIIIFLIGWCKPIISLPLVILIFLSIILKFKTSKTNIKEVIKNNKRQLIIILILSIIMITLSGIGGFVYQNEDHLYRNAIFENLINNKWPIYNEPSSNYAYQTIFTYYFASWLPASIIGKITNIKIGYLFLYLWNVLGLFITFCYIKYYFKGKYQYAILLFILFSGLDVIAKICNGDNLLKIILSSSHIEWATTFQMSSFTTQLFWVYNQAIPAWLVTFFILNEENNTYLGIIIAMSLLFCTFPTAGLIFIFIYKILSNNKNWFKTTFTWQNIIVGIPILIINLVFLTSNTSSQNVTFGIIPYRIINLILLYITEFGFYYIICYKYVKNKKLFWVSLISLIMSPLVKVGYSEDFCMRSCIPSQLILFTFILETIPKIKKDKYSKSILIILLCIGSITPINEIIRTIKNTDGIQKNETINLINDSKSNNFYGKKEDNLFVIYISK